MSNGDFTAITPARLDWRSDTPVARDFDAPYFSRQDGMAERDHVFLQGNRLAERFAALTDGEHFAIGETGFGTGLNALLTSRLFVEHAPAGARLDLFSVEKHPLTRGDLARALLHWPHLTGPANALLAQYPAASPGFHRLWLAPNVALTLMLGDATALWRQCDAQSVAFDAWFLDGFAPARNPDLWQPALFAEIARLSRPGATLATVTTTAFVRRGLLDVGFAMARCDDLGDAPHRLTGAFGDAPWRAARLTRGHAIIAGAGLAGATSARALVERGWRVTVLDPDGIAGGASGNRAGVVYSTPSAHLTAQNRFYQVSYGHALRWLHRHRFPDNNDQGALNGVIQHYVNDKQRDKITKAAASGAWPTDLLTAGQHDAELPGGGYINPAAWCETLLDHPAITLRRARLRSLTSAQPATATLDNGETLTAEAVVLATAGATRALSIDGATPDWLPLKRIRGQVSYCQPTQASGQWRQARCHGGYLTPALAGLHCVGATFDLHDPDAAARNSDDDANLAQLKHYLPEQWRQLGGAEIQVIDRRVAFRCQSTDFLPLAGALTNPHSEPLTALPGLWLNIAHGSRGITGTPLCAEILADRISAAPAPADRDLLDALDPARFIKRRKKAMNNEQ